MQYTIYYKFTTLNAYISAERTNKYVGAKIKRVETEVVRLALLNKQPFKTPVRLKFTWLCKNKRIDPDNRAFAKKFVLDGMVKAHVLEDDTMRYITGFIDEFVISDKEGVIIEEVLE